MSPFPPIPRPAVVPAFATSAADLLDIYPTETIFGIRRIKMLRPWNYCSVSPFQLIPSPYSYSSAIRAMVVAGVATVDAIMALKSLPIPPWPSQGLFAIEDAQIMADEINTNAAAYK